MLAISGFVLRRYVRKDSNRRYGNWFSEVCKQLQDQPLQNLITFLTIKGWPNDEEFTANFQKFDLYLSKYARPVIQGLESASQASSEPVVLDNCSIEHVLPQTVEEDEYGLQWREDLGDEWERIYKTWLHTPGNLTLVGNDYNIEMQNKPFNIKRLTLIDSKVYLNRYFMLITVNQWNEAAIKARGLNLAKIAVKVWIGPESELITPT